MELGLTALIHFARGRLFQYDGNLTKTMLAIKERYGESLHTVIKEERLPKLLETIYAGMRAKAMQHATCLNCRKPLNECTCDGERYIP